MSLAQTDIKQPSTALPHDEVLSRFPVVGTITAVGSSMLDRFALAGDPIVTVEFHYMRIYLKVREKAAFKAL